MDDELIAILLLACYGLTAAGIVLFQAARCPSGWRVWVLYVIERLYIPLLFHWRSENRCPFPDDGPALVIGNHRSPVDPLLMWMHHHLASERRVVRPIEFLTAREYVEIPGFVGWICYVMRSIPVERAGRDMGPTREALRRLGEGRLIGVFPEGRINEGPPDTLLPANPGIAFLALRAKVPVYPVFITGSPQGKSMVAPFHTFSRVWVKYGKPIDLSEYYDKRKSQEVLDEVTALLMRKLGELGGATVTSDDVGDGGTANDGAAKRQAVVREPLLSGVAVS